MCVVSRQFAPDDHVPAVQADGGRLRLHPPGLQVVQLRGNSCGNFIENLFANAFFSVFNNKIPQSSEGKDWFWYVDKSVTLEQLEELTVEFLAIFNKCPSRLRRRVMQQPGVNAAAVGADHKESSSAAAAAAAMQGHSESHPASSSSQKVRPDASGSSSSSAKPGNHDRNYQLLVLYLFSR